MTILAPAREVLGFHLGAASESVRARTPRIGLLATHAEDYCRFMDMPGLVRADAERLASQLARHAELVDPGIILSDADADRAIRMFRDERPDIVVAAHLSYTKDDPTVQLVRALPDIPIVLYLNQGFRGLPDALHVRDYARTWQSNSIVQITATLKRFWPERIWPLVVGHASDDRSITQLADWARGAGVLRSLASSRVALLPDYCQHMYDTWPDPALLERTFGTNVVAVRDSTLHEAATQVTEADIDHLVEALLSAWTLREAPPDLVRQEARLAFALREVAGDAGLDAIGDMHLGGNIGESLLANAGVPIAAEGDVAVALIGLVLQRLSGAPILCFEHLGYDLDRDLILGGHKSFGPPGLAAPGEEIRLRNSKFGREDERGDWVAPGVALEFPVTPGPVTLASLGVPTPGKLVIRVIEGESIPHARLDLHYPYTLIRLKRPGVERYFTALAAAGGGHHFSLTLGHVAGAVRAFGAWAGVEVVEC